MDRGGSQAFQFMSGLLSQLPKLKFVCNNDNYAWRRLQVILRNSKIIYHLIKLILSREQGVIREVAQRLDKTI